MALAHIRDATLPVSSLALAHIADATLPTSSLALAHIRDATLPVSSLALPHIAAPEKNEKSEFFVLSLWRNANPSKNKASWNSLFLLLAFTKACKYKWKMMKKYNTMELATFSDQTWWWLLQKSCKYQEINMKVIIKTLKKMPKHTRGKPGAGMYMQPTQWYIADKWWETIHLRRRSSVQRRPCVYPLVHWALMGWNGHKTNDFRMVISGWLGWFQWFQMILDGDLWK